MKYPIRVNVETPEAVRTTMCAVLGRPTVEAAHLDYAKIQRACYKNPVFFARVLCNVRNQSRPLKLGDFLGGAHG